MKKYVFGYGSLMYPRSLQKTLPGKTIERRVRLRGYRRKFNIPVEGYLYFNIVPEKKSAVEGVLIRVSNEELNKLKKRETGYECVDVSARIADPVEGRVYVFIAPNKDYPTMKILKSYINTCLDEVPEEERERWIKETIIRNKIEDDTKKPRYRNADA